MRIVLTVLLFISLASVADAQLTEASLPDDVKILPDAQIEYTRDTVPRSFVAGNINGVRYTLFHHNARGVVEGAKGNGTKDNDPNNWSFICQRIGTKGQKSCGFSKKGFFVQLIGIDRITKHWIGTLIYWQDDENRNVTADSVQVDGVDIYSSKSKQFSPDALTLLGSGKLLTLHRGNDPRHVITHDLYGFDEALELSGWALKLIQ